jgi:hypothetical protein
MENALLERFYRDQGFRRRLENAARRQRAEQVGALMRRARMRLLHHRSAHVQGRPALG